MNDYRFSDDGSFEIRSAEHGACLLLRRIRDGFIAKFDAPGIDAAKKVYVLGGCDGFDEFWRELAGDWRGWEGTRSFGSLDGELELSVVSDRLGHVTPEACLSEGSPFRWRAHGIVALEAGQLDCIAADARTFCRLFKKA